MKFLRTALFILVFSFILSSFFTSCSVRTSRGITSQAKDILTEEVIRKHIQFLASDSLKGRNTPSPGLDTAAAYIAKVFSESGVKPFNGSYFQVYSLCSRNLGDSNRFSITRHNEQTIFTLKTEYTPFEISGSADVEGEVVFAGYGITAPELNYDDYQGLDVKGKLVLIFRHEPRENDSTFKSFNGSQPTKYSNLNEKMLNAKEHGALGLLIVTEPLNNHSMKPRGFPWPALSKTLPPDAGPLSFCDGKTGQIPLIHVGEEVIKCLFGSLDSLKSVQKTLDSTLQVHSFTIPDARIFLRTDITSRIKYTTRNVVGMIEGTIAGSKNEVVVIGAHYDHVGFIEKHKTDTDYIFNGADDNASGTSGVLAIAQAMASLKVRPERSVLFLLFSGEEKGLFGSEWYVNHPLISMEKTIAMFNLDMISRNAPDTLDLIGAKQSPALAKVIRRNNKVPDLVLIPRKMSGGSDHWNFYRKGVPCIFFFAGLHKDYHQVTDNPDKVDAKKAARVAQLVFYTTWDICNNHHYYSFDKDEGEMQ